MSDVVEAASERRPVRAIYAKSTVRSWRPILSMALRSRTAVAASRAGRRLSPYRPRARAWAPTWKCRQLEPVASLYGYPPNILFGYRKGRSAISTPSRSRLMRKRRRNMVDPGAQLLPCHMPRSAGNPAITESPMPCKVKAPRAPRPNAKREHGDGEGQPESLNQIVARQPERLKTGHRGNHEDAAPARDESQWRLRRLAGASSRAARARAAARRRGCRRRRRRARDPAPS